MDCYAPIMVYDNETRLQGRIVPCGRCLSCLQRIRSNWTFRIKEEAKNHAFGRFITLTYNNESVPKNGQILTLKKTDLQKYIKRVREAHGEKGKDIKYYAIGEYGSKTGRPHYHAIIFDADDILLYNKWGTVRGKLNDTGFVEIQPVSDGSIHYVTGYVLGKYGTIDEKSGIVIKDDFVGREKPFALMSKGLGKSFIKKGGQYCKNQRTMKIPVEGGKIVVIPRYYKDKLFSESEIKEIQLKDNIAPSEWIIDKDTGEVTKNQLYQNYVKKGINKKEHSRINHKKIVEFKTNKL